MSDEMGELNTHCVFCKSKISPGQLVCWNCAIELECISYELKVGSPKEQVQALERLNAMDRAEKEDEE